MQCLSGARILRDESQQMKTYFLIDPANTLQVVFL